MAVKRSSVSRQGTATREIVVVGGVRTPMGKFGGYFAQLTAVDLAVMAIRELMARTPVSTDALDAVIIGNVIQPAEAPNIARVISLTAGVPRRVPAHTVHRNCASGMQAVTDAAEKILAGRAEVVLAGGVESMTHAPLLFHDDFRVALGALQRARGMGAKAEALMHLRGELSLRPEQVIAMGDGANDLKMMAHAGVSIAYHAKPVVRAQASYALNFVGLDGLVNLFV